LATDRVVRVSTETVPAGQRGHHVEVRGATKRYGATTALSEVSFAVEPGQFLVLLGPSGSGKSTLIRSIAGVERFDTGVLLLNGSVAADGRHHLPPERRDLAMVFQDYALWPHLTVHGNVSYALRRRRLDDHAARARTDSALDRVGLARYAHRYPHELSGGEQQRVALARAVVGEPKLLLFDEPLSNLDADLRERLRVEIATLTRETGATAVYITHDQAEAFALADKIGVLERGALLQLAAPEEIYRHPAAPFVARFTGTAGELPGQALAVTQNEARVAVGDNVIAARCIGTVATGAAVELLVRPAATHIEKSGSADGSSAARLGWLDGVVADVAYRGRGYDHVVVCPSGTLTAVHDADAYARGTPVRVRLDRDGCMVHERPAPSSARNAEKVTAVNVRPPAPVMQLTGQAPRREYQ